MWRLYESRPKNFTEGTEVLERGEGSSLLQFREERVTENWLTDMFQVQFPSASLSFFLHRHIYWMHRAVVPETCLVQLLCASLSLSLHRHIYWMQLAIIPETCLVHLFGASLSLSLRRHIYWTENAQPVQIMRSGLDGRNREVFFLNAHMVHPDHLLIDYPTLSLYWVDTQLGIICRIPIDTPEVNKISDMQV